MTEDQSAWEPAEDERRAIRNALLESRPDLAGNEEALLLAEKRVVDWVTGQERELSLKQCSSQNLASTEVAPQKMQEF